MKGKGMCFALKIVSKSVLIYFEMKGATCSFAKSGMGNNRVRQGMFPGNLEGGAGCSNLVSFYRCWLFGENRWVLWGCFCLSSGSLQVGFGNSGRQSSIRVFSSRLFGWLAHTFASCWHHTYKCHMALFVLLLAEMRAKDNCFQGQQQWSQTCHYLISMWKQLLWKSNQRGHRPASGFLLRECQLILTQTGWKLISHYNSLHDHPTLGQC